MEMGLLAGMFVMSALSALCSVAALVVLLIIAEPKEKAAVSNPAEKKNEKPPDMVDTLSGEYGGTPYSRSGNANCDMHQPKATPDDVEKRRREAVQAKEHSNFMNYDGTPQQKIDPALILGE